MNGVAYNKLTTEQKVRIIEYWVNNPDETMAAVAGRFNTNDYAVSNILTKDYFGKRPINPVTITLQSAINDPSIFELLIA